MEALLVFCLLALLHSSSASPSFAGKEFAVSFMQNHMTSNEPKSEMSITITAQQPSQVKVQVPSLNFLKEKDLKADQSVTIHLPDEVQMSGSNKYDKTALVTATADVTVTSSNHEPYTGDKALVYPIPEWGTEYIVFTPPQRIRNNFQQFSVTNGKETNNVSIELRGKVLYRGQWFHAGEKLKVVLEPYESLQLQGQEDLTGSRISSKQPVGVLSGHTCTALFGRCNHVYEQLLPVSSWGSNFIVAPLSFGEQYDSIFIQASQPTLVTIKKGTSKTLKNLSGQESVEVRYSHPYAVFIEADHGIQVLMLFNGVQIKKNKIYDSFLMTILPTESFCSSYSLITERGFDNVAMIVALTKEKQELRIDGKKNNKLVWQDVPGTGYSFSQVTVKQKKGHIVSSSGSNFAVYGVGVSHRNAFGAPAQCRQPGSLAGKSGICWAVGDPHYHTFDGRRFDFMGTCTYLIAKNCETNTNLPTFEILAQNENRGSLKVSYVGLVTVKIAGFTITAVQSEIGRVRVDNTLWSLPVTLNEGELHIFQSGRSVFIQTDFGLFVRYDWKNRLVVTVPSLFAGKTCGLCGNFNGDPTDDFTIPEGNQAAGALAFGTSWKVPGLVNDVKCRDECVGGCGSCTHGEMNNWDGDSLCELITRVKGGPFSKCHAVVDPMPYMENCKYDICMGGGLKYFLCKSLESYADACQEADVQIKDWRKRAKCPYECPANSKYEQCGSACPATCSNPKAPKCPLPCVETCSCKKGFVLMEDKCLPAEDCGCTHQGRYLGPGQSVWADDCQQRCTCNAKSRSVQCQAEACRAGTRCQVLKGIRDCHPISYSTCRATGDPHYVSFDKKKFNFQGTCVYQMVKHSGPVPFEVLVQNEHRGRKVVSFTRLLEVKVYNLSIVISKAYRGLVMVNGELANLPLSLAEGRVSVHKRGWYAVVTTTFGLKVSFNWKSAVFVTLPSSFMGQVSGLCGNYNGEAGDDLIPKNGNKIVAEVEFGASWRVEKTAGCEDDCEGVCPSCDIKKKKKYAKNKFCGIINDPNGPFRDCHAKVDPADYFEDCVFDVCLYEGEKDVLCQAITSYSSACQDVGAEVHSWRTKQLCEVQCPPNSHYEVCAAACPANCQSLFSPLGCQEPCREGCSCQEGFVLSGERCVAASQCGCVHRERYYSPEQIFYPNGKCEEECKCNADGEVECKTFACGAEEECVVQNGRRKCQAGVGTCRRSGRHYRSFDGRAFNFQGTCSYTLSKTRLMKATRLVAFDVRVENTQKHAGGKNAISIPEAVAVDTYGFTVTMRRSVAGVSVNGVKHRLPLSLNNGAVNVYQKGVHYVMATDFGLLLTYNRKNLVSLTIPGYYKGQTSGLCGNFNDDPNDDLQQPDGMLTDDLKVFGGSWKVSVPGVTCEHGCNGDNCLDCTHRKPSEDCHALLHSPFGDCHAKVNPKTYSENCAVDSCASNGDSMVVCDSIAAYAFSCHLAGIHINWRTDTLCPMKCPANSHYEACSDTCGATCPGLTEEAACGGTCSEGCSCDDGFLFDGQACVRSTECGCYDNGKKYKPREVVYGDDCKQRCTCDAEKGLVCEAHTCPANSECLVKDGVRSCVDKDPCERTKCDVGQQCVVKEGQAVCVPKTKTCWAWGDPHYRTFDGLKYNLQSNCSYIYSKTCGDLQGLPAFLITESNVKRSAVSYVSEVTVSVHGFNISAHKEQHGQVSVNGELVEGVMPLQLGEGKLTVSTNVGSVSIETDFGLWVHLEWNWKLVVHLPNTYQGKVCGLCGNFNGIKDDELQAPGGAAVSTVEEWGQSWLAASC